MIFEFSVLQMPEIPNRLQGPGYEKFKHSLVALMLRQRSRAFEAQASAEGPWPPLSSGAYAAREGKLANVSKKRLAELEGKGFDRVRMLQDTGVLHSSFTDAEGPGKAQLEQNIGQDEVSIATNVAYAAIQNFGGTVTIPENRNGFGRGIVIPAHQVTIPARPYDQFTEQDEAEIAELTEHFLNGNL